MGVHDATAAAEYAAAHAEQKETSVLEEAHKLVYGPRRASYGHPLDNFTATARMWSVILKKEVSAEEAAMCMIAVKLCRQLHKPDRDNIVDTAGYAGVLDLIISERAARGR